MPELPEVETVVRDLRPLVVGRTVVGVRHGKKKLRKPWDAAWNALVAGCRIDAIRRRGKWIVIELASRASHGTGYRAGATGKRVGDPSVNPPVHTGGSPRHHFSFGIRFIAATLIVRTPVRMLGSGNWA